MKEECVFEKNNFGTLDLKGCKYWRYALSHTIYACFYTLWSFEYVTKKEVETKLL